jgi:hypothetical protein
MKFIRIGFVAVLLLLLVVPVGWAKGEKPAKEPSASCDVTVEFREVAVPGEDGDSTTTWYFWVSEPDGKCKDLSNWAVVLPDGAKVVDASPSPYEVGTNPHTGEYSIKWDVTDSFTSGEFSVTLDGNYFTDSVSYATKAGPVVFEGTATLSETGEESGYYPG